MKKIAPSPHANNRAIVLLAILLAFFALIVFIWLWYDLRLKQIEKGIALNATSSGIMTSVSTSRKLQLSESSI